MPRLNWTIINANLREAREQPEEIEAKLKAGKRPSPGSLELMIEHAYHHMNCAWNARFVASRVYRNLTDSQFNEWGRFPDDLQLPFLGSQPPSRGVRDGLS